MTSIGSVNPSQGTIDWEAFQTVFNPSPASVGAVAVDDVIHRRIFVVCDESESKSPIVVSVFCPDEDFTDWLGAPLDELREAYPHRDVAMISRETLDRGAAASLSFSHLLDQSDALSDLPTKLFAGARAAQPMKLSELSRGEHFLLQFLRAGWMRFLPTAFGFYLQLRGSDGKLVREVFGLVRSGRLESFFEPDLTSLGAERVENPERCIRMLSERFLVPVQGLTLSYDDWMAWGQLTDSTSAWRGLTQAIRQGSARLMPFRWTVVAGVAAKAYLRV